MIQIALPFIPSKYKGRIESGLAQAESMLAGKQINTFAQAVEVMRQAGIDKSCLSQMQGYLNNGLVNTVLSAVGVDKNNIAADLEKLKLNYDNINNGEQQVKNANSDLEVYKKNLGFLNKK